MLCTKFYLAFFTGHKLCFGMFLIYSSYTEIQQIWSYIDIEITCLKGLLVNKKIIRTDRVQDIVSIWYVAARKLCFVVDSQVKIWPCTLSYKNCHLTLSCLQHHFGTILQNHFGTILTIFEKFKYNFDFHFYFYSNNGPTNILFALFAYCS